MYSTAELFYSCTVYHKYMVKSRAIVVRTSVQAPRQSGRHVSPLSHRHSHCRRHVTPARRFHVPRLNASSKISLKHLADKQVNDITPMQSALAVFLSHYKRHVCWVAPRGAPIPHGSIGSKPQMGDHNIYQSLNVFACDHKILYSRKVRDNINPNSRRQASQF